MWMGWFLTNGYFNSAVNSVENVIYIWYDSWAKSYCNPWYKWTSFSDGLIQTPLRRPKTYSDLRPSKFDVNNNRVCPWNPKWKVRLASFSYSTHSLLCNDFILILTDRIKILELMVCFQSSAIQIYPSNHKFDHFHPQRRNSMGYRLKMDRFRKR